MSDNKKPNFFGVVPAPVLFHSDLSDFSVRLFGVISTLCQSEGYCNAKNKTLADWLSCSPSKVSRAISELSKHDLITVDIQKNSYGTYRKLFLCISRTQGISKDSKGGIADLPNPISKDAEGGIADLPIQKNSTSINSIKTNKKGVVPLNKEQLRAKQFAKNVEQVEFPSSWSDGLKSWVKRYMTVIHDHHTTGYYSPKHLEKTIKEVYSLQANENKSAKYIADLITLCAERKWKSIYSSYLEDKEQAKVLPKFQRLV